MDEETGLIDRLRRHWQALAIFALLVAMVLALRVSGQTRRTAVTTAMTVASTPSPVSRRRSEPTQAASTSANASSVDRTDKTYPPATGVSRRAGTRVSARRRG